MTFRYIHTITESSECHLSFQDTGCAIQFVKVPPIDLEKFPKCIPMNRENFLKITSVNPEIPKELTNKGIFTKTISNNPENVETC